jgi:hypothetical protein
MRSEDFHVMLSLLLWFVIGGLPTEYGVCTNEWEGGGYLVRS